jgi:hypothetical protein
MERGGSTPQPDRMMPYFPSILPRTQRDSDKRRLLLSLFHDGMSEHIRHGSQSTEPLSRGHGMILPLRRANRRLNQLQPYRDIMRPPPFQHPLATKDTMLQDTSASFFVRLGIKVRMHRCVSGGNPDCHFSCDCRLYSGWASRTPTMARVGTGYPTTRTENLALPRNCQNLLAQHHRAPLQAAIQSRSIPPFPLGIPNLPRDIQGH